MNFIKTTIELEEDFPFGGNKTTVFDQMGNPILPILVNGVMENFELKRGDSNNDNNIDISDPINILEYLFSVEKIECQDFADANDDGQIDISDPIYLLTFLFLYGDEPPFPFIQNGLDPTDDKLECSW